MTHRLWGRPAAAVLGIDAPPITEAANKLIPVARAKVSVRLAPGDDVTKAKAAIHEHISSTRPGLPWGAEVTVTFLKEGAPHLINPSGGAFDAFRRACCTRGDAPRWKQAAAVTPLGSGAGQDLPAGRNCCHRGTDPESQAHSENESVHLAELMNCCVNEAILLSNLAREARA